MKVAALPKKNRILSTQRKLTRQRRAATDGSKLNRARGGAAWGVAKQFRRTGPPLAGWVPKLRKPRAAHPQAGSEELSLRVSNGLFAHPFPQRILQLDLLNENVMLWTGRVR